MATKLTSWQIARARFGAWLRDDDFQDALRGWPLLALFAQDVPGLRIINLGGEMCPQALVDKWATPARQMFNTYGPTEATVSASLAELKAGEPVTIGEALPNYGLLVIEVIDPDSIVIAGSTASIKSGIETQLNQRYGNPVVTRVAGADRYETSRLLTDRYWGDAQAVFFAVGATYPDALAGAALAGALGSPLLITEKSCMTSATRSLVLALDAEHRVLLGSSAVLSDKVAALTSC